MAGKLRAPHLKDIERLFIIEEPDEGGATFVAGVARRLAQLDWAGEARIATMPSGLKDPNELHKCDPAGFIAAFESALDAARPMPVSDEDPLANIGDRAGRDRGAPFEPDVLSALVDLRETDPARYARVRGELKRSGTLLGDLGRQMRKSRLRLIDGGRSDVVAAQPAEQTDRYCVDDGAICSVKLTNNRPVHVPLCNFQARIVAEEVHDDGVEERRVLVIEGALQCGTPLPRVSVAAERYPSMAWVSANWGTGAIVCAGWSIKDQLREAIQRLSGDVPRAVIYVHMGWREIGGEWMYLHAGGAIGARGIDTFIQTDTGDHRMRDFDLPAPPEGDGLSCAVRASLSILEVAPHGITVPLLAAVYRAPLNVAAPVDFAVFMTGQTGTKKTALTALAQAHFGRSFNDRHLPGNWESTANALEKQAFLAKDALLTVDDFAPGGTIADAQRLHLKADRLLRAQGNLAGRQRMGPDGSLRREYVPRGLILSSGEDVPRGHSLRARMLILDIDPKAVDVRPLSTAQSAGAEGHLALAMAAYIQWLSSRVGTLRESLPEKQRHHRDALRASGTGHDRTPDLVASLSLGWEMFIHFARSVGAIGDDEFEKLLETGNRVLAQAAVAQSEHQSGEEPTTQFLELLRAALVSGRAHVSDTKTGEQPGDCHLWGWRRHRVATAEITQEEWQPQGDRIGWLEGDDIYFQPDVAFAMAQRVAREQGTTLPITMRTLWRRLAERGLLKSREKGKNTNRKVVEGRREMILHVDASLVIDKNSGNRGNGGE